MDPDLQARRLFISTALTTHTLRILRGRIAADSSANDLLSLARPLSEEVVSIERRHHLRFEPSYPGVTAGVENVGSFRLTLACTAYDRNENPLGVVFTTLVPGRLPQVSVAPSATRVPKEWRPLADMS